MLNVITFYLQLQPEYINIIWKQLLFNSKGKIIKILKIVFIEVSL